MNVRSFRWLWSGTIGVLLVIAAIQPRHAQAASQSVSVANYDFSPIGLVRGQTVRVNLSLVRNIPPGPCRILIYNAAGRAVGDTGVFQLPAVQRTLSFDFDWAKLGGSGEGGRLEVRPVLKVEFDGLFPPDPCRTDTEIVDNSTGATLLFQQQPLADFLPAVQ